MVLVTTRGETSEVTTGLVLTADISKEIHSVLKTLSFRENVIVMPSDTGLKFTVEEMKSVQGNAYLKKDLFTRYVLHDQIEPFRVNLGVLCECLNLFGTNPGSSTTVKMLYAGHGEPLRIVLEESGVVTDCSIKTQESEDVMDFEFHDTEVVSKIVMKAEPMRETFQELDSTSEMLEVKVTLEPANLRFTTNGNCGDIHTDFPEGSEVIEKFECQKDHCNKYRLALLKRTTKALQLASKISVRSDSRGFLSLQYMIELDDANVCFVEFFCAPEEDFDI